MDKKEQAPEVSKADQELLAKYLGMFQTAWKEARPFFDRANEDVALFEQEPDLNSPTLSDISLGQAKLFVDQIMPSIFFSLFGDDTPFELLPGDKSVTYERGRKVRDWVLFNMNTVMNIMTEGYLTIKDAVKLGCGYGIIEPKLITPPAVNQTIVYAGDEEVKAREMAVGETVMIPSYTYLPFGQVIPMPDGKSPEEVSCVFVLRFYPEDVFRKMLDKQLNPDSPYEGNADEIVKYARANSMNGYVRTPRQIAEQINSRGRALPDIMNTQSVKGAPISVPVLQCYSNNEHVFFACDRVKIYHKKSKFQTLRCPVVKATFDPDGNKWYTPGIINPRKRMIMGTEMFYNGIMDMLTMVLHPHQVINRDAVVNTGETPDLQPYGKTVITGAYKTGDVVSFVPPPALPPFLLQLGDRLEEFNTSSVGQPKALHGQGTAGLVRGGSGAMESLMQSTAGREKMIANHFQNGWYLSVVEQSLILCQMLAGDKELMPEIKYDPTTGKNDYGWTEITQDDIRQVFKVKISFTEKMANQLAEITRKAMIYDRALKNPYVNQKEAFAWLVGNTKQYHQLTEGVNPKENVALMQAMGGAGATGGGEGAGAEAPGANPLTGGAGTAMGGLEI
ncbi:MAG: hypothetical protein M0R74_04110 [Dehalococcoidia bacterium]|nr:hypothetical protein [Dehalococcoidia bacterium]